ncbi:MAG: hypothetical protein ABII76_24760 [Pseudomonadota bacterium]
MSYDYKIALVNLMQEIVRQAEKQKHPLAFLLRGSLDSLGQFPEEWFELHMLLGYSAADLLAETTGVSLTLPATKRKEWWIKRIVWFDGLTAAKKKQERNWVATIKDERIVWLIRHDVLGMGAQMLGLPLESCVWEGEKYPVTSLMFGKRR